MEETSVKTEESTENTGVPVPGVVVIAGVLAIAAAAGYSVVLGYRFARGVIRSIENRKA